MKSISIISLALVTLLATSTTQFSLPKFDEIELVKQVKQCLQEQDTSAKAKCVANALGSDLVEAKQKAEALLSGADQKVIDYLKAKGAEVHQYLESKQGFIDQVHDKAHEYKEKAESWFNEHFGKRQKRDMPTQAEVALAKRVKICMDMTQEKTPTNCLAKILGENNHANVDSVKIDTIVKYEAVLEELKEFFAYQKQGHTLKEFIAYKKEQQAGQRQKRGIPSFEDLVLVKYIVEQCQKANPDKNVVQCAAIVFGPDLSSIKEKLEGLINSADPRIVQFLKENADKLHQYFESKDGGIIDTVHDKAHELKEKTQSWFTQHFG